MQKLKHLLLSLFLFIGFSSVSWGQIRFTTGNHQLGTNSTHLGRITDVKYVPNYEIYLIVGDFTRINASSNTVNFLVADKNLNPITNFCLDLCNGPVNAVEYKINPTGNNLTIWLGGAFDTISLGTSPIVSQRQGFCELSAMVTSGTIPTFSTFTIESTNPLLGSAGPVNGYQVNDLLYLPSSSKLIVGGHFDDVTYSNASITPYLGPNNLFSISYSVAIRKRLLVLSPEISSRVYSIETTSNPLQYAVSDANNMKTHILRTSTFDTSTYQTGFYNFDNAGFPPFRNYASPRLVKDKKNIYRNTQFQHMNIESAGPVELAKRNSVLTSSLAPFYSNFMFHPEDDEPNNIQVYNDDFFTSTVRHISYFPAIASLRRGDTTDLQEPFAYFQGVDFDIDYDSTLNYKQDELIIAGRYLFYSDPSLSFYDDTLSGALTLGRIPTPSGPPVTFVHWLPNPEIQDKIGVFCLEPIDPKPFINADTAVCAGNEKTYGIAATQFASGYKWEYTGDQSKIKAKTSPGSVFASFNPNLYINFTSIFVQFQDGFNGGQLKVTPFNFCNNNADTLFAKSQVLNLTSAPLPDISVTQQASLNCLIDSALFSPGSSFSNVVYGWQDSFGNTPSITDSIFGNNLEVNEWVSTQTTETRNYYLNVTETSGNQCRNRDTISVIQDKRSPVLLIENVTGEAWTCNTDSLLFEVTDSISSTTGLTLNAVFNQGTSLVYPGTSGYALNHVENVFFTASYLETGCESSSGSYNIVSDDALPSLFNIDRSADNVSIVGNYLDTLTCFNDSTLLTLSSTSDYLLTWTIDSNQTVDSSLLIHFGLPQFQTFQDSLINASVTVEINAIDVSNGCEASFPAFVNVNIQAPALIPFNGDTIFNCSEDSLILAHIPVAGVLNQGWLAGSVNNSNDSLSIFTPGQYVYEIQDYNGCVNYDTINTVQTSELVFSELNDTIVCADLTYTYTAQTLGSETYTYSWLGGTTGNAFSGIGGLDTLLIVNTSNGAGCFGSDTVLVSIPAPMIATFTGYSTCGSNIAITLSSISGGAVSSFTDYSFKFNDETSFTPFTGSLPTYSVDSFASYPFAMQDTLGCTYETVTSIEGLVLSPSSEFLVSTYNQSTDTLYIVNINSFTGYDFVRWSSPTNVNWVNEYDTSALFSYADTGWVEIVFTGYVLDSETNPGQVDTCAYPFSKWIYFGENEVIWDDKLNQGIISASVAPNPIVNGSGTINVIIEFGSALSYQLFTLSSIGAIIPSMSLNGNTNAPGTVSIPLTLPSLAAGNYHIHVITEFGAKHLILTVQ